jgi:hypothetical protein
MPNFIANSTKRAQAYTSWHKYRIFAVGISYGPEGIVIVYHESHRSFFQFIVEGKQCRYWLQPSPTKQGLVRIARRTLRQIIAKSSGAGFGG